jgi:FAD-dependent urate hydroxylase
MTGVAGNAAKQPMASGKPDNDVAIIGAGPYGLSAGAYLRARGLGVCIFGCPMDFWANQMPAGMLLRSPRAASSIADPQSLLTLERYEAAHGLVARAPVPLEMFVNYGRWFQLQIGVSSDTTPVQQVTQEGEGFRIELRDGRWTSARRVVVAAGIGPFAITPGVFAEMPSEFVSHCYEGPKVTKFFGKRVAVIGAGQSALESAVLLQEAGAQVEVIARIPQLRWIGGHQWLHHLGPVTRTLYSKYDVGPVGISRLVASPAAVARIPLGVRDRIRSRAVRPAGAPWLVPRLGGVTITTGRTVQSAKALNKEVHLTLDDRSERHVDHVLLGTGYRVEVSGYRFLSPTLVSRVRQMEGYPALSDGFCSSVPGLHFIGAPAARAFGPLLYFVAGTEFASERLAAQISRHRMHASA